MKKISITLISFFIRIINWLLTTCGEAFGQITLIIKMKSSTAGAFMSIDIETVRRVANLARIKFSEDELLPLSKELSNILEFMKQLNAVDVEDVMPLTSVTPMELHLRSDNVNDGGKVQDILQNAPKHSEGFFSVPKVIE